MTITAAVIRKMVEKGLTASDIAELCEVIEEGFAKPLASDERLERKRARDAARMAEKREVARQSHDVASDSRQETPLSLSPPPQTPPPHTHTPPEYTTRAKGRATRRCPEDWGPSLDTHGKLISEGFTAGDLERALTRMRDHEFKTARLDWDATFRNWVRTDADRKPPTRISPNGLPAPDAKRIAREENLRRAYAGSEMALGGRS